MSSPLNTIIDVDPVPDGAGPTYQFYSMQVEEESHIEEPQVEHPSKGKGKKVAHMHLNKYNALLEEVFQHIT